MDIYQAIVLAVLQGLTEFLPISSSAHLILLPKLLGWQDQGIAFDVAVHVGTLVAVLVFLRKELSKIIPSWLKGWQSLKWNQDGLLGWMIVIATIPVGLVGLFGGDWIEINLRSPIVIVISTLFFAILLWWSDRGADTNEQSLQSLGWKAAFFVGMSQACALIPGTSRSGVTMTAMLALGYARTAAAKFSFLLAVPTIILSGVLKTGELMNVEQSVAWDLIGLAVVISALVAFWCMRWFMVIVERVGMLPFVLYRLILAICIWIVLV